MFKSAEYKNSYVPREDFFLLGAEQAKLLAEQAENSELGRYRIILHDKSSRFQSMLICLKQGTKVDAHRQRNSKKLYIIIEGELGVVFFNNSGELIQATLMSRNHGPVLSFDASVWHTTIPLTDKCIYYEQSDVVDHKKQTEFAEFFMKNLLEIKNTLQTKRNSLLTEDRMEVVK